MSIAARIRALPGDLVRWVRVKWAQLKHLRPTDSDRAHLERTVKRRR